MPVSMTGNIDRVEVITSVQRRRRWSAEEKARIVQETYAPGMSVSLVARQHGVAPNQVFKWRQLYAEGALSAVGAGEEVVAASEYRALQHQVRQLQRLLGKKTLENEILREALDLAQPKKRDCQVFCVGWSRETLYVVEGITQHVTGDQRRGHRRTIAGVPHTGGFARRRRAVQGTQEAPAGTGAGRRVDRASGIREGRSRRPGQW